MHTTVGGGVPGLVRAVRLGSVRDCVSICVSVSTLSSQFEQNDLVLRYLFSLSVFHRPNHITAIHESSERKDRGRRNQKCLLEILANLVAFVVNFLFLARSLHF